MNSRIELLKIEKMKRVLFKKKPTAFDGYRLAFITGCELFQGFQ